MIEINVTGAANAGKSTLVFLIKKTLQEQGFVVGAEYLDDLTDYDASWNIEKKANSISKKQVIKINEIQLKRTSQ